MVSPVLGVRTQVTKQLFWKGQPSHSAEEVEMGRGFFLWDMHGVHKQELDRRRNSTISRNMDRSSGVFEDSQFERDGRWGGVIKIENGSYFTQQSVGNKNPVDGKLDSLHGEQTSASPEIITVSKEPLQEDVLIPTIEKIPRQIFSWELVETSTSQPAVTLKYLDKNQNLRNKDLLKKCQRSEVRLNNQNMVPEVSQKKCIRKIHTRRDGKRVFVGKWCFDVCKCQRVRYQGRRRMGHVVIQKRKLHRRKNRQRIFRSNAWKRRLCRQVLQLSSRVKNRKKERYGRRLSEGNGKTIRIGSRKKKPKWFASTQSKTAVLRRRAE